MFYLMDFCDVKRLVRTSCFVFLRYYCGTIQVSEKSKIISESNLCMYFFGITMELSRLLMNLEQSSLSSL